MNGKRPAILSDEETDRLIEILGTLRRIQQCTGLCLEALTELVEEASEIGRRHGVPAFPAELIEKLSATAHASDSRLCSY